MHQGPQRHRAWETGSDAFVSPTSNTGWLSGILLLSRRGQALLEGHSQCPLAVPVPAILLGWIPRVRRGPSTALQPLPGSRPLDHIAKTPQLHRRCPRVVAPQPCPHHVPLPISRGAPAWASRRPGRPTAGVQASTGRGPGPPGAGRGRPGAGLRASRHGAEGASALGRRRLRGPGASRRWAEEAARAVGGQRRGWGLCSAGNRGRPGAGHWAAGPGRAGSGRGGPGFREGGRGPGRGGAGRGRSGPTGLAVAWAEGRGGGLSAPPPTCLSRAGRGLSDPSVYSSSAKTGSRGQAQVWSP